MQYPVELMAWKMPNRINHQSVRLTPITQAERLKSRAYETILSKMVEGTEIFTREVQIGF